MKCMCKANHPDPDIREEYCDGATMTLFDYEGETWWYCYECGNRKAWEVTARFTNTQVVFTTTRQSTFSFS